MTTPSVSKHLHRIDPIVVVGLPTLRNEPMSWEWADYFYGLAFPLGCAVTRLRVKGKYVADARNEICQSALQHGAEWIFMIGDDVHAPQRAFEMLWRHKVPLATGVYWSKYQPCSPYLWNNTPDGRFLAGPYTDWTYGETFKVDWAGCDCLLINAEVLKNVPYPWFSHDWNYKGEPLPANLATEDVYFYTKCREAGIELLCDTSVQCDHVDRATGIKYGLTSEMPQITGRDKWKPTVPLPEPNGEIRTEDAPQFLVADLGAGTETPFFHEKAKVIRIDADDSVRPDIRCDLRFIPEKSGTFDIVHVRHVLEHFAMEEHVKIVREWVRILRRGGTLYINVPNLAHAAREILKAEVDPNYDAMYAYWQLYGRTLFLHPNEFHKSGFTKHGMRSLLSMIPELEIVSVEAMPGTDTASNGHADLNIVAIATKKKEVAPHAVLPVWDYIRSKENGKGHDAQDSNFASVPETHTLVEAI